MIERAPRAAATGLLLLVVLFGGALRCWNLDWDGGAHLHPDERYLAIVSSKVSAPSSATQWFDTDRSPLNPANHGERYVYGTAPLFAGKGVATWLEHGARTGDQPARAVTVALDHLGIDLLADDGTPRFDGGYQMVPVGRLLSALLDTTTIVAVYLLGAALGTRRGPAGERLGRGRRVGLVAALAWAVTPLAIQQAHFFVVEPMLTAATAWALLAAVRLARGPSVGRTVLLAGGLAAGVAGASKISGLSVLAAVGAGALIGRAPAIAAAWRAAGGSLVGRAWAARSAVVPLLVDAAVLVWTTFVVLRLLQPYAFHGLGLDARWRSALADLSVLQAGADVPTNVQWADRVPVLEPVYQVVRYGFGLPMLALAVVGSLGWRHRRRWSVDPARAVLVLWVVGTVALFTPRFVSAMRYLLPAGPAVAALAGAGAVRLLAGRSWARRTGLVLVAATVLFGLAFANGVYGRQNTRLAASDWLVANVPDGATLSFQEWDDGLPVGSEAATAKGFRSESLAPFALVTPDDVRAFAASLDRIDYVVESSDRVSGAVAQVPARQAPVLRYYAALADGRLGFEEVASFTSGPRLFGIDLGDGGSEESFRVYDHPPVRIFRKTSAFSLERALAVLEPDRATVVEQVPLLRASGNGLMLRGDADAPGTGPTFASAFPDRLPVPWLWWWGWWELTGLAALPWVTRLFRSSPDRGLGVAKVLGPLAVVVPLWAAVAFGLVRFSLGSAWVATLAVVALGLAPPAGRRELRELWRTHRRAIVTVEVLTVVAFVAVLLLRSADPDLWYHPTGGEKPFGTAYFTAVARSSTFPPADPWFSGGAMNYYYGGWFALSVPTRLLGIRPEVALNLGIATVVSMAAAAAWSVGAGLAGRHRAAPGQAPPPREGEGVGTAPPATGIGLLAAVGLFLVGNLASARQQVDRLGDALGGRAVPAFDWWGVSRVSPGRIDIDEFPGWTVLFGDPHPHLLAIPVLLTLVAVLAGYGRARRAGTRAGATTVLAALAGAGVAWTQIGHTWDWPTSIALTAGGLAVGTLLDLAPWRSRLRTGAGHVALAAAVAVVLSAPYRRAGQVFDSGFVASPAHTRFGSFLLKYGLFGGVAAAALAVRAARGWRAGRRPAVLRSPAGLLGAAVALVGAAVLALDAVGPSGTVALALCVASLVAAGVALRAGDPGATLAAGLVAAGAALAALPELVVVVNDLGRMNTVFKFGFTAQLLLVTGAAASVGDLVGAAPSPRSRRAWLGAVAVALVPGLLFWPSATEPRLAARFRPLPRTLDGRAWLDHGPIEVGVADLPPIDVTADEPMIDFLRARVRTGDTLVEDVGPSYSWVARLSVATGIPTVVGWQFHQVQQRRGYASKVDERVAAVAAFYRDPDQVRAWRFLAAYRPDYVAVGTVERALGTPEALDALDRLPGLEPVYRVDGEIVYAVDHAAIDDRLAEIDAAAIRARPADPPGA